MPPESWSTFVMWYVIILIVMIVLSFTVMKRSLVFLLGSAFWIGVGILLLGTFNPINSRAEPIGRRFYLRTEYPEQVEVVTTSNDEHVAYVDVLVHYTVGTCSVTNVDGIITIFRDYGIYVLPKSMYVRGTIGSWVYIIPTTFVRCVSP